MEAQLVACVRDSIEAFLFENAKFMGERLYAEFPSEENMLLLATVYIKADQAYRAYSLLSGAHALSPREWSPQGRYLLAQCCHRLGKLEEAKSALVDEDQTIMQVPGGAAGCYLLGKLHSLTDNPSTAISCYQAALIKDPLLWSAYEGLCQLGHSEDAAAILSQVRADAHGVSAAPGPQDAAAAAAAFTPPSSLSPDAPAFVPSLHAARQHAGRQRAVRPFQEPTAAAQQSTPDGEVPSSFVTPSPGGVHHQPPAPVRRGGPAGPRETPSFSPVLRGGERRVSGFNADHWKFLDDGKLRKVSNRLFSDATSRSSTLATTSGRTGRSSSHAFGSADASPGLRTGSQSFAFKASQNGIQNDPWVANGKGNGNGHVGEHEADEEQIADGLLAILGLLSQLGEGYGLLCKFRCREAIDRFERLPPSQQQTAWVSCQVGRACYELSDFAQAAHAFQRAQQLDKCRLEGMEYYSTVLWHLKREIELSHLAQKAIALDRLDPRSWCIMGNCFSLQKDHEAALKFFQRALQLDPSFTYAYTLAGHENLDLEQYDKSMACFRNAMRLDPRHHNAWYGVGQIYFRQEKYEMAAYHFESSLKINMRSSVLRCYVGMALGRLGRLHEAADMLRQAVDTDTSNPLARFELAHALLATDRPHEALRELEALKDITPREASVYFSLGKVEKRLNRPERAHKHFSAALDLNPSSAEVNLIKSAIDKLTVSDEHEEDEM